MRFLPTELLCSISLIASSAAAQTSGLMYSTRIAELANQCAGGVTAALNNVEPNSMQYVEPIGFGPIRSQAAAPTRNYDVQVGDHDGNTRYVADALFSKIDAILRPRDLTGAEIAPNQRNMFFSPRVTTTSGVGLTWSLRAGDVGRVLPSGGAEKFITMEQIQAYFGMTESPNVDAVALDVDTEFGGLFLSFGLTRTIDTLAHPATVVRDGAILRIPTAHITWATSSYNGALLVATVAPLNVGEIVLTELQVDAMVNNSGVADNAGGHPTTVGDLDGLTTGGWWDEGLLQTVAGTSVRHLWFSGLRLTGGVVLTTNAGGLIARLNGVQLGNTALSNGAHVGLVTAPVDSLNGLVRFDAGYDFIATDSLDVLLGGGGTATVEVGGLPPGTFTFMLWNFYLSPAYGIDPAYTPPFPTNHFPELYLSTIYHVALPVAIGAGGCGQSALMLPAGDYHVVCQSISDIGGVIELGSPCVIDVRLMGGGGGQNPNPN